MHELALWRMAWRNLWRNRRRTMITLSSIAFGTFFATMMNGIGDWQWSTVIDTAAKMGGGHVVVQHPEYGDRPAISRSVANSEAQRAIIAADEEILRSTTRVSGHAMLATASWSTGVAFIAFDPAAEDDQTLSILEDLAEGKMFESADDPGIILGAKLAEMLDAGLGRKVVYTMSNADGDTVSGLARVSGIIRTQAKSIDAGLCLLPINRVRKLVGYGADEGTHLTVFIDDHRRADAVAARLDSALDDEASALTWAQAQPDLAGFIAMKVGGLVVMEIFMMVLIAAGIFNTLFVGVMERLREMGIMLAVGMEPRQLFGLVLWESLWLGLVGIVCGVVITALPYYLMATTGIDLTGAVGPDDLEVAGAAMEPLLKVGIYPESAMAIAGTIVAATLTSGIYPAWRASRVVPVDAIKLV